VATATAPVRHMTGSSRRVSGPGRNSRLIYGVTGAIGFLLLWELGSRSGIISEYFFSRPTLIAAAGMREVQLERFWNDVRVSATEFVLAFLMAIAIGVPLGLLTGWYRRLNYFLDPWLNFFNSLPRIALIPVIITAVGLGMPSKIIVAWLGAFFAIVIPTVQGVKTVDRRFLDVAHSLKASQWTLFSTIVAPATVPFMVTGIRLGIARALIGVLVGELYAATEGLGVMIIRAADVIDTSRMLFGVLIFTVAGLLLSESLRRVEKYFQKWRPQRQGAGA
jgi:ABC-type nitrate/sulfonate/bicarbonate transport system permease component